MDESSAVVKLFENYIEAFNRGDFDACLSCYRLPFTFITAGGVAVLQDQEAFLTMWRANHAQLVRQGWSHSRTLQAEARLLDENIALLSVLIVRHRADGGQDAPLAGIYNVRRGREGWKFITAVSHRGEGHLKLS